jgi:hypothetical protein
MNRLRGLIVVAAALAVTGCVAVSSGTGRPVATTVQSAAPTADPCAASAAAYNGVVAGSFVTTAGAIRRLEPLHIEPELFTGLPDSHPAMLCYIDGQIPKAPPPPLTSGTIPPSFDRAVIAVIDGQSDFIIAGYRDNLPVVAPAAASETSATPLPPGGISQERAVQLAVEHESNPVFLSAAAGPFAQVNAITNLGPDWDPNRSVWAIRFEVGGGEVCPPPQPSGPSQQCELLGPRAVMVILDYYTGDFIISGGPIGS